MKLHPEYHGHSNRESPAIFANPESGLAIGWACHQDLDRTMMPDLIYRSCALVLLAPSRVSTQPRQPWLPNNQLKALKQRLDLDSSAYASYVPSLSPRACHKLLALPEGYVTTRIQLKSKGTITCHHQDLAREYI
jgi:hypothetical protein